MSCYYRVSIKIEGYRKENQNKIVATAQEMWSELSVLEKTAQFKTDKGWVMFGGGEDKLSNQTKEQFLQELKNSIWQANQGFCKVEAVTLPDKFHHFLPDKLHSLIRYPTKITNSGRFSRKDRRSNLMLLLPFQARILGCLDCWIVY